MGLKRSDWINSSLTLPDNLGQNLLSDNWTISNEEEKKNSLQYNTASPGRRGSPVDLYPGASARCALRHCRGTVGHELCVILVDDLETEEGGNKDWHTEKETTMGLEMSQWSFNGHPLELLSVLRQGSIRWLIVLCHSYISFKTSNTWPDKCTTRQVLASNFSSNAHCHLIVGSRGANVGRSFSPTQSRLKYLRFRTFYLAPL